jgi:AraC-like DNA-binding protein
MRDIHYDFVDLDNDESFELLAKSFGGVVQNKILHFDTNIAKGELIKAAPDKGLWLRKWKFTTFQKIILHKLPAPEGSEKKFILIYFLNPAIFFLTSNFKKIKVHGCRNNIFMTSEAMIDFSVIPKQPFYVLDITFTRSWLLGQFEDADPAFKNIFDQYVNKNARAILTELCTIEEYKTLHELEIADGEDVLFIRSRVYNLMFSFFNKIINRVEVIQSNIHYQQIMQVEMMIMENLKELPKLESIARKVNMSVSSLLRQFKLIHGKSIHEYYVAKKMELAKKMILENKITIRELSEKLGYKQASAFIESFTKHVGYSPGSLKHVSNQFLVTE